MRLKAITLYARPSPMQPLAWPPGRSESAGCQRRLLKMRLVRSGRHSEAASTQGSGGLYSGSSSITTFAKSTS